MSKPSNMFVAGDISQTILGAFFLGHPVFPKNLDVKLTEESTYCLLPMSLKMNFGW